jgi:hypothetical protein
MAPGGELARLLAELQPDRLALRDWVAPLLDASMIDQVAPADYGSDVKEHRRGVRGLLTVERLPGRLAWHRSEVLEVIRWSMPDDPTWKSGGPGRRGHLLRLFSCLVLVRTHTGQDPTDSLVPLVDSALQLDPAAVQAALRFRPGAGCTSRATGAATRPTYRFSTSRFSATRRVATAGWDAALRGAGPRAGRRTGGDSHQPGPCRDPGRTVTALLVRAR